MAWSDIFTAFVLFEGDPFYEVPFIVQIVSGSPALAQPGPFGS